MKKILILFLLTLSLFGEHIVEYDYELDAYYSNVSAFIDLDRDKEVVNAINMSESDIYTNLLLNTFSPNIMLFEASIHPMSIFGLYFRQNHENQYNEAKIEDMNLVKVLTAGFEEPYSFSFFIGRMMIFKDKESTRVGKNRAYMGYLVTVGDYTIKDNAAHYDRWVNFELKLKGTRERDDKDLDWSFRVGSRIHENTNFANTLFFGARRSSIDYKKSIFSFLYNSAFSSHLSVTSDTFELTDAEITVEKKWPLSWTKKSSFGLGLGYLYTSGQKYRGELREEGINNHQLILRPNFKW